MVHKPIVLKDVCLHFPHKNCFNDFSSHIYPGNRIAIIGRNGSGKSSLLNILRGTLDPSRGDVMTPHNLSIGYVEQTVDAHKDLSGGQRFNQRLSEVLGQGPDLLLLDEPTNHLDQDNRKSLMRMLSHYPGTLVVISHDTQLLRNCIHTLWHIDSGKIHEFSGNYDDYTQTVKQKRSSIEKELGSLKNQHKNTHSALMKEQRRAAKSKAKGQKSVDQRKWPTVVSKAKATRAEQTSGKKKAAIDQRKQHLTEELSNLHLPEVIVPKFSLSAENISSGNILSITHANVGYTEDHMILTHINLTLSGKERIALCGKNASGKSTLLKAILNQKDLVKTGNWHMPPPHHIGYLDQHYAQLNLKLSVIEHVHQLRPDWDEAHARKHLNDFLFRKNEEVTQAAAHLSGGEKARASLCLIAAKMPKLLILDEITNNLDLETKEHVVQVLQKYPSAMIVVSHEDDFLQAINIDHIVTIKDGMIVS
jgi:ATPase subunit of ABC transporter with duplicated ATPase domains